MLLQCYNLVAAVSSSGKLSEFLINAKFTQIRPQGTNKKDLAGMLEDWRLKPRSKPLACAAINQTGYFAIAVKLFLLRFLLLSERALLLHQVLAL